MVIGTSGHPVVIGRALVMGGALGVMIIVVKECLDHREGIIETIDMITEVDITKLMEIGETALRIILIHIMIHVIQDHMIPIMISEVIIPETIGTIISMPTPGDDIPLLDIKMFYILDSDVSEWGEV